MTALHLVQSDSVVLDASALIALLADEPGAEAVSGRLPSSLMSVVNLAEVLQWGIRRGEDVDPLPRSLRLAGLRFVDFDSEQATEVASLWLPTHSAGLSLGDRACIALARLLRLQVVTAERIWRRVDLGVEIQVIR